MGFRVSGLAFFKGQGFPALGLGFRLTLPQPICQGPWKSDGRVC